MLDFSSKRSVGEVTRLHSSHLTLDGTADESKIAVDIQKFVTSGLIVEIELHVVKDATLFHDDFGFLEEGCDVVKFFGRNITVDEHDGIGQVAALDEVTADERLKFVQEDKCTAGSNLAFEIVQVVQGGMLLVEHLGVVFHLHVNIEMVARLNGQLDAQNLVLIGDRLFDDEVVAWRVLLDDARLMDGFHKILAATVHNWSLFYVDVNQHIIDAHATQRSQDMLNCVYLYTTFSEGGATGCIDDIIDISLYNRLVFKINPTKTNSRIYRSRVEGEGAALTCVEPCSFDTDSIFERTLFLHKIKLRM